MRRSGGFMLGVIAGAMGMTGALWYLGSSPPGTPAQPRSEESALEEPAGAPPTEAPARLRTGQTSTTARPESPSQPGGSPEPSSPRAASRPSTTVRPSPDLPPRTDDDIEAMARRNQRGVSACYQVALAQTPSARGTIRVRIVVGASGRVTDAQIVADSMGSTVMASCLLEQIRTWRFRQAASDYIGVHTFTFAR